MTFPRLNTDRLSLEPLTIEQLDAAHTLWIEPGVRRFLWDNEIISRDRASEPLRASEKDFREQGFGLWGLYSHGSRILLGFCGLRIAEVVPDPELLFGLGEAYWGRGLATDAARAVLRYAFDDLHLRAVGAACDVLNTRSVRVIERLGMRVVRRCEHHGLDTLFFQLTAEDWVRL